MTMHAMGPFAGWRWLVKGINLGRNNPRAIFGGIALLALVALVPSVIQLALQYGFKASPSATLGIIGSASLLSLLIYPLLIGGMLRVIDASEQGRPTRAAAVFDTFKSGQGAGKLIGFGVLVTLIYLAVFMTVISLFGKDFMGWYGQLISAAQSQQPGTPPAIPALPAAFGRVLALGSVFGLFLGGVYAIGFGQVALNGRSVLGALGDGFTGTLKNLLPLLVLAVCAFVLFFVFALLVALIGALLAVLGGLLSQTLAVLLVIPVYLGMLLVLYVVLFGCMYYLWRDVAGNAPASGNDQVVAA